MFFKLGVAQLFKNKARMVLSILTIGLGVGVLFGTSITADTLDGSIKQHFDAIFGNVDFTIYKDGSEFVETGYLNQTLPEDYLLGIRALPGIHSATSRLGRLVVDYHEQDMGRRALTFVMGINASDPQERDIGTSIVIDAMAGIVPAGENATLEDLLATGIVAHPVAISMGLAQEKGYNMGEQVFFTPQNATALYATPGELESVANGTMSMENLERVVSRSPSRFVPFTIVGILVDGCEAPRMPFSENTASVDAMVPPKNGYYITMEDAHDLVFNNVDGMASFFLVDAVEGVTADLLFRALEPVITGDERARVFDVRAFLNAYMDYASSIARTILLSLSAISIVACSQLIKTTTQMNLSEKIRELGIFQAMGFKRKAILDIAISQVLFVSVIGTGIGFLLGTLLPLNFDLSIMVKFLSGNRIYAVASSGVLTISMTSILTSIGAGIGLPLLFSSVPAAKMRSWTIVEMMNPVYMQVNPDIEARGRNARSQGRRRARRHHVEMKQVVAWLATLVAAITLMAIAPYKMFPSGKLWIRGTESFAWLGLGCLGIVLFLVSLVEITGGGMGMVSRGLSWLFKRYLGPVQAYVPKAIHAHSRRMRNIIGTLLVGTALLVSISIVHDTVSKGDAYSNRTYIGGDVAVYTPLVSQSDIPGIENVPGVGRATVYLYDVMETWRSNIQDGFKYIVNQVDGYGGKGNNINERLDVVVIDPGEYATVNAQGVMHAITKPDPGESIGAFVSRLDEPGTVILQDALARDLHKEVGDRVDANILGITGTLEIVGMATNLPCGPFMHTMDDGFNSSRMAFTSFNTLRSLVEDFIGDVDIVVKNASVESSFIGDGVFAGNVAGYSSGFIDKNQVAGILSTIPGIASSSFRFSTFAPGFPVVNATYDATRVEYLHPNVALAPGMELSLPLRFFIVDPEDDLALSGRQQSIVDAHDVIDSIAYTSPYFPGANTPHNSTVDEVLYTIDKFNAYIPRSSFNDTCYCVANQHVARYSTVDNLTYVYENKVGDVLEVEFQMENETETHTYNFTVLATVDNHLAYYHANGTEREGYVFSSKILNYNSALNKTVIGGATFLDIFDTDGNVLFTTFNEMKHAYERIAGTPFGRTAVESLVNHVYIKVEDSCNVTAVASAIQDAFLAAGMHDFSVIDYKDAFIDRLARRGSLAITIAPGWEEAAVLENLEGWYKSNGYTWFQGSIATPSIFQYDVLVISPVFNVLTTVMIFSLVVSVVGLCTVIFESIKQRGREFGIMRALGFSNTSISRQVSFESLLLSSLGVLFGMIAGLLVMYTLFSGINYSLLIPLYFSIPWDFILPSCCMLIAIALAASIIVGRRMGRLSIAENIRYRE